MVVRQKTVPRRGGAFSCCCLVAAVACSLRDVACLLLPARSSLDVARMLCVSVGCAREKFLRAREKFLMWCVRVVCCWERST